MFKLLPLGNCYSYINFFENFGFIYKRQQGRRKSGKKFLWKNLFSGGGGWVGLSIR